MTDNVPDDIATRHVLVVTEAFRGQSRLGFSVPPYPKGFVLTVATLGQTNIYAGQGPRHPKAVLIEHTSAEPGDVLQDDEVVAGIASAIQKQALVPEQQKAREAQKQAAMAADPPFTAEEKRKLRVLLGGKP